MKNIYRLRYLTTIICVIIFNFSCKKDVTPTASTSLSIVNAVVGSNTLVTNFSQTYTLGNFYANALQVSYGYWSSSNQLSSYIGNQALTIYQIPDTTEKSAPFYSLNLSLPQGSIHTLFLIGTTTQRDTLFSEDHPPYHNARDSSVGVRFVNLSPGSSPVNVTLSTSSTINEFQGVNYKGITGFKSYPATASVNSYTFEIRDAVTQNILATQTLSDINNGVGTNNGSNQFRFRNVTIAFIGLPTGTGAWAQQAFVINNY